LSFAFGENKTALGVRIISDQVKRTILRPLSNTRERARRRRRRRRRKRGPPRKKKDEKKSLRSIIPRRIKTWLDFSHLWKSKMIRRT
jgi:hypothetical protein